MSSDNADIADLNPEFHRRLNNMLAAANAAGITTRIISGYRDNELQRKLHENYLARQAGQPLPYASEGSGGIAAPPGGSYHNYGFAGDVIAGGGRQQDLINFAYAHPEFGVVPLPGDAPHFQIAGSLADARSQWGSGRDPGGSGGAPQQSLFDIVAGVESGNQNIIQQIHDINSEKGTPAGGYWQIIDPTWQVYAQKAGVDVAKYPFAMSAPREIQQQVASAIPINQWGNASQAALKQAFPGLDTSMTLGEAQALYAKGGNGGGGSPAQPMAGPVAMTPAQSAQMSAGQILAQMGQSTDAGGVMHFGGDNIQDPPEQPAYRSPALGAQFTPQVDPVPVSPLATQMASLSIPTAQDPVANPEAPPVPTSITQGAPSMTAMRGTLGNPSMPNLYDPRRTNTPDPYMRYPRIG